jgi:hypothetical protein
MSDQDISADALVHLLACTGRVVTKARLATWHRAGLIPEPRVIRLGRGKGTESVYPAITVGQAEVAFDALGVTRNFGAAAWRLWWTGYLVPEKCWRPELDAIAHMWDRTIPLILPLFDAKTDDDADRAAAAFDNVFEEIYRSKAVPKFFAQIRHDLRKDRTKQFLIRLLEMAVGQFQDFSTQPELYDKDRIAETKIFDVGMGLTNARRDYVVGSKPWLSGDVSNVFRLVSELISKPSMVAFLASQSAEEIEAARTEFATISDFGIRLPAAIHQLVGVNAFGYGRLGQISANTTPAAQAGFLLLWLAIRPQFADKAQEFIRNNEMLPELERLAESLPAGLKIRRTNLVFPYDPNRNTAG